MTKIFEKIDAMIDAWSGYAVEHKDVRTVYLISEIEKIKQMLVEDKEWISRELEIAGKDWHEGKPGLEYVGKLIRGEI